MSTLYLCGAGNSEGVRLAQSINERHERWDRIVLVDDDPEKHGRFILGVEVIGAFSALGDAEPDESEVTNLVARTTRGRKAARGKIESYGLPFAGLINEGVETRGAEVAQDVTVYHNATVGPEVTIDDGTVIFMGAVVGHECHVGQGCVIAANSVLNARVELGEGVYVGTNATVLPEIRIGAWATIGAGSVVVQDVPDGATVMGVPAQILIEGTSGRGLKSEIQLAPDDSGQAPDPGKLTHIERTIAEVWREVLCVARVNTTDNFFDLGGTSLHALQVRETLLRTQGSEVTVIDLFRFPTIQALALHLVGPAAQPRHSGSVRSSGTGHHGRTAANGDGEVRSQDHEENLLAMITQAFQDVLGIPEVAPEDNFFDLGGDTDLAHQACAALHHTTGRRLCFMQIVRSPTAKGLARVLGAPPSDHEPTCLAGPMMTRLLHRQGQP